MSVFFLFLLALAAGSLSTLFAIPEGDLGRGYFQMNALVVLGLLALAVAVYALHPLAPFGPAPGWGGAGLAAGVAGAMLYYAAIWNESWRLGRLAAALALAGCGAALLAAGPVLVPALTPLPQRQPLLLAALVSSALLLGWSLIAMLLGHWYLVAPKLAFRHLSAFCWAVLGTVLLRCAALAATLLAAARVDALVEPHPLRVVASFAGQGMFFWFRLLWGLAIPLALAAMALHCARQRSNQSATGILYVLVVGTFIGEITALYLAVTTGVPV
jgi:hypothetical protein